MTTEAVEPANAGEVLPPQPLSPFQRIVNNFQMELGRLNGQLLVERTEREIEREQLVDQINSLTKQLQDAGVVPKGDGQPQDKAPNGAGATKKRSPRAQAPRKQS